MNWMGGPRSRVMKSSDVKKQKEFFEKKRKQKSLNQAVPPASPKGDNAGNIDMLTMFIVNQIALKKEKSGKPKLTHLTSSKDTHKFMSQKPIELPMSPCSPSCLSLVESEPHYSVHTVGLKKRKQGLMGDFHFKALSPVMEVNHSDNSALDYKQRPHHHKGSVSSFSSASPTPSEAFHPRAHISPPYSWEPSCMENSQVNFVPFSELLAVSEHAPWTAGPHQTQAIHISPASEIQFRRTLHSTETSIHSSNEYPPNLLEGNNEQDESLFLGFNHEDYRGQDLFSEKTLKKIHLQRETSSPTRTHELPRDHNADSLPQAVASGQQTRNADSRPYSAHCSVSENACEIPVGYSLKEGRISFNTENKQYMKPHKPICHTKDMPIIRRQYCSSGMSERIGGPPFNQKIDTQNSEIREKNSRKSQDMGTQTAPASTSTFQDASVQCYLLKPERRPSIFTKSTAPIHQNSLRKTNKTTASATRRQEGKSNKSPSHITQCTLAAIHKVKWDTPLTALTKEATLKAPDAITAQKSSHKPESGACANKYSLPVLRCSHTYAPEDMVVRGERCEGHEEGSVNQNPAENAWSTEEHSRKRGVNLISGETETLQEVADILMMLKQKNNHPLKE
ncbi:uncharacterized protein [Hoplias malabaricus]|uniref:uncharacterized protein isoform X2 n=1 Tax=Hoplias malabaricus TaxID=27720 RepID=UPI0034621518